jgi:hypothetical protein
MNDLQNAKEAHLKDLREIISARINASAETIQAVKSPDYLVNFYMGFVNYYWLDYLRINYVGPDKLISVDGSYSELSREIKAGPLCWEDGKRICPYERHTLAKYVSILTSLNLAYESYSGFVLKVPPEANESRTTFIHAKLSEGEVERDIYLGYDNPPAPIFPKFIKD